MLSVAEALAAITQVVERAPCITVPLEEATGLVLADDVRATIDSPPFDKALMDGFAVRSADLADGRTELEVIDEVTAGCVSSKLVGRHEAIRIMTGAPMPLGADAVIPVEECRTHETAGRLCVETGLQPAQPGRNVLRRGAAMRQGDRLLAAGSVIRPVEAGCLAELGLAHVRVHARPRVAVLSTGDELVTIDAVPGPGQIRNSNEILLAAQLRQAGAEVTRLGIARDNRDDLARAISQGLSHDVLVLTGGVSAGRLDLVPQALARAGARQVFHRVCLKPGQPLWFGVFEPVARAAGAAIAQVPRACYVFGLPGNPVSSLVCCQLFVRTALRRIAGIEPSQPCPTRARLRTAHFCGGNRPTYHPARLMAEGREQIVDVVPWIGSADQAALVHANGLAVFPEGNREYASGVEIDFLPW